MKKKVLFIINPISGGKKKDDVPGQIARFLDKTLFEATIIFTTGVAHARHAAAEAVGTYDVVVAVGGDGTVNETAAGLVGSQVVLGIIPCGSGNGLSRFLQIPMNIKEAILNLNEMRVEAIDSAEANGMPFFNVAGLGFDAHIGHVFADGKKRGFLRYAKSALTEILNYQSHTYYLTIDGVNYAQKAFILSIANSSQYGNNAHISPKASVQDGSLDVCIVKPFPLYRFPELVVRMFTKTADGSSFVQIIKGQNITVKRDFAGPMHLDGEPVTMGALVDIKVKPGTLNVIVGDSFNKPGN
ncbi:diacylglycerol/lipid kinase family protein [Mucilaginibacter auburnensis]|uniref:YegS/Rv2252/BmrU family lipid kinase n=1 Tax=Mucilaginibacter auburnensis TaxID=1457233 RepID=A0A2H9VSD4_9SPHI|nr:diacylglycerol kinase family protein [Mucilaginibacter auburnensis]PJJ83733.1 YegS/Rv2252/BmrU family lipid kinase [Mucilaginibacter auburnensis]